MGAHRLQHDPSAAVGVPAHVTLLYPFLDLGRLDDAIGKRLSTLVARVPTFAFELSGTAWFGDQVLYLAVRPPEPFLSLIAELAGTFDLQPYGGAYPDVVPHVTVAQGADPSVGRQIEAGLQASLPLSCQAGEILLMVGSQDSPWRRLATFTLG